MYGGIHDLIIHPDAFFARITDGKTGPIPPLLIIVIAGCINCAGLFLAQIFSGMHNAGSTGNFIGASTLIYYLVLFCIVPLVDWVIVSAGCYCISRMVFGRGSLAAIFRNAGYGMVPWIIFTTISSVYAIVSLFLHNPAFPFYHILMGGSGPAAAIFLFSLGCYLWMYYLWTLGMKYTGQIPFWKAAGIILIPVIIVTLLDDPTWVVVLRSLFSS